MSKILINNTATDIFITDTGVTVSASFPYVIPPQDYATFAASSNVITELASGNIKLNDGSSDIDTLSKAVDILKGFPPQITSPFFFDTTNVPVGISVLQDLTTTEGAPIHKALEGEDPTGKNAVPVMTFKDTIGNFVYPQLTASGKIPVDTEAAGGTAKYSTGVVSGSLTEVLITEIILSNSMTYNTIKGRVSCFRNAVFRLVWDDNGVETNFDYVAVGSGFYSSEIGNDIFAFESGAIGNQKLRIFGINSDKESDFRASLAVFEQ